jgi:hypothetical protein
MIVGRRKAQPMTVFSDNYRHTPQQVGIDFSLLKTCAWGYTVLKSTSKASRFLMRIEVVLLWVGLGIFTMVLGLWLMPGTNNSMTVIGLKTGLSMALGIAAMAMIELAGRGLRREIQFDSKRKQIRSVWRNRKNRTSLDTILEFEEINSIFVRRHKMPQDHAVLNIRFGVKGEILEVASGEESAMRALWEKLNNDLLRALPERTVMTQPTRPKIARQKVRRPAFGSIDETMARRSAFSSSSSSRLFP